eukprot:352901-Chlamydomonas_euryale.AAC.2
MDIRMIERESVLDYLQRAQLLYKKLRNGPGLFQVSKSQAVSRAVVNLPKKQPSLAARMGKSSLMLCMQAGPRVRMMMQGSRELMPNPFCAGIAMSSGTPHASARTRASRGAGVALLNSSGSCHRPSHRPHRYRRMRRHRRHGRMRLAHVSALRAPPSKAAACTPSAQPLPPDENAGSADQPRRMFPKVQ